VSVELIRSQKFYTLTSTHTPQTRENNSCHCVGNNLRVEIHTSSSSISLPAATAAAATHEDTHTHTHK
jgi:hypothetical protein